MTTRYQFQEELGRGAMGVVYRAFDPQLNRTVAIKVLKERPDPVSLARFLAEGEVAARVRHPNVLGVHDLVVPERGSPYLVTDYAPGGSLRDVLEAGRVLEASQVAALLSGVCGGVAALHERGVIHRDLKPDNLLFAGDGTPLVADLGLARALDRETRYTQSGVLTGTPSYMAPEQLSGRAPSPATDVYALGVILYEVLAGRLPFDAEGLLEQIRMLLEVVPPRPSSFRLVDPGLEAICLRCLKKDPSARYPDARALGAALSAWEPGRRPGSGRLAAGVLALVVGLSVAAGGVALAASRAQEESSPTLSPSATPSLAAGASPAPTQAKPLSVLTLNPNTVAALAPLCAYRAWGLKVEPEGLRLPNTRGEGPQLHLPFTLRGDALRLRASLQVRHLTPGASYALRIVPSGPVSMEGCPGGPPIFTAELSSEFRKSTLIHGWSLRVASADSTLRLGYRERGAPGPFEVELELEFADGQVQARAGEEALTLPWALERGDYWLEVIPLPLRVKPDDAQRPRNPASVAQKGRFEGTAPGVGLVLLRELRLEAEGSHKLSLRRPEGEWAKIGALGRQSALPDVDLERLVRELGPTTAVRSTMGRNETTFLRFASGARRGDVDEAAQVFAALRRVNGERPVKGRFTFYQDAWLHLGAREQLAIAKGYAMAMEVSSQSGAEFLEDARRLHLLDAAYQPRLSWTKVNTGEALLCLLLAKDSGQEVDPILLGTAWFFHGGLEPALLALEGPAEEGSPTALLYAGAAAYFLRDYARAELYWKRLAEVPEGSLGRSPWSGYWRRLQRIRAE